MFQKVTSRDVGSFQEGSNKTIPMSSGSTRQAARPRQADFVDTEEAALRKEEEKFNQFVVTVADGLGLEQ